MDFVFIDKLQSITLTEEEGEVITVGATHREKILEQCSLRVSIVVVAKITVI